MTPEWNQHLQAVLLFHVSDDNVYLSTDLDVVGTTIPTLWDNDEWNVTSIFTEDGSGMLSINDVTVIAPDNRATNGVVHVVNDVLLPSFADTTLLDLISEDESYSTLLGLLEPANITSTLSDGVDPLTLFAPTNDAVRSRNLS